MGGSGSGSLYGLAFLVIIVVAIRWAIKQGRAGAIGLEVDRSSGAGGSKALASTRDVS